MALPLGKKSLAQIERRADPARRLPDLAGLLEWLLRLSPPPAPLAADCPALPAVVAAYEAECGGTDGLSAAVAVSQKLAHLTPGAEVPTGASVEEAAGVLRTAVIRVLARRLADADETARTAARAALHDPFGEMGAEPPAVPADAGDRLRSVLGRLETASGRRASHDPTGDSPEAVFTRLRRHAEWLRDVSMTDVIAAFDTPAAKGHDAVLVTAAKNLEAGLESVLAFDATWRLGVGVPPLPAIRLEPDLSARIRLLTAVVEHLLAWVAPRLAPDEAAEQLAKPAGTLLRTLLDRKGHLVGDADAVRFAAEVRNRLARVVPDARPVLIADAETAERALWAAAHQLRGLVSMEHADRLSAYPAAAARTRPADTIRTFTNPAARLRAWHDRLVGLALVWSGRHPGGWPPVGDGGDGPPPWSLLARHPRFAEWGNLEAATRDALVLAGCEDPPPRPEEVGPIERVLAAVVTELEQGSTTAPRPMPPLSPNKPALNSFDDLVKFFGGKSPPAADAKPAPPPAPPPPPPKPVPPPPVVTLPPKPVPPKVPPPPVVVALTPAPPPKAEAVVVTLTPAEPVVPLAAAAPPPVPPTVAPPPAPKRPGLFGWLRQMLNGDDK